MKSKSGQAAVHLEDRDRHIGWDDIQRGRRLNFMGQNSRRVVLDDRAIASFASHLTPAQFGATKPREPWPPSDNRPFSSPFSTPENPERNGTALFPLSSAFAPKAGVCPQPNANRTLPHLDALYLDANLQPGVE